jgi:metallophosphoesterase superfamily enzyme
VHDPQDARLAANTIRMAGHWHPAVLLKGRGRQRLRVPCFWFGKQNALLPAAGAFTGGHVIEPEPGDRVYAWTRDAVWEVS